MLRYFILTIILFFAANSFPNDSEGTPYLIHFNYDKHTQNQIWSVEQTPRKTILIAKRTGLLEFDSESWSEISTPDIPLKIFSSESGKIFISGRGYIGELKLDATGRYAFEPISDPKIKNQLFTGIYETESSYYFYSSSLIIEQQKNAGDTLRNWSPSIGNRYGGMFYSGSKTFVKIKNKGFQILGDTAFVDQENEILQTDENIVFHTAFDSTSTLIGTSSGTIFKFDGIKFSRFELADDNLLSSGNITDGKDFGNNLLAISTRNFGVVIIDKQSGETASIIGKDAGLPSDHIMALLVDDDSGLWMAHANGLSRIDSKLPITNFSSYTGLDVGVNAVRFWNNRLYLATTTGVYSLDSISHYDTREVTRRIPIKRPVEIEPVPVQEKNSIEEIKTTDNQEQHEDETIQKKGFLRKLFGRKKQEEEITEVTPKESVPEPVVEPKLIEKKTEYQSFKYETFVLKSKTYGYAPLLEINEKCNYLMPFSNHLLAVSDSRIYAIAKDKQVAEIFASSYIYDISFDQSLPDQLLIIASEGIFAGSLTENNWEFNSISISNINFRITAITQLTESGYLLALNNQLVFYSSEDERIKTIYVENPYSETIHLKSQDGQHYVIVGRKLYYVHGLDYDDIKLQPESDFSVLQAYMNQPENLWIKSNDNRFHYFGKNKISANLLSFLQVFKNVNDIHIDINRNIWVVDDYQNIYKLGNDEFDGYHNKLEIEIKSIEKSNAEFADLKSININYSENALRFSVIAPTYLQENSNQYQYIIEGLTTEWSSWSNENIINVPYIPSGKFVLKVRARDILGNTSEITSTSFRVSPPFWKTPWFFALVVVAFIVLFYSIQQYRMKKLVKEKKVLSEKVKERTIELELKNKAITDSINYAGKMQSALLPSEEVIQTCLSDSFLFFKPRNIVSGDFYWATQKNKYTIVAAADCTGHGVPGAFMSMLGMALMSEIVSKTTIKDAAQILNILREKIIQLLTAKHSEAKDGMDIALLIFNKENNTLQYAGAHNPLYRMVARKNKLSEEEKSYVSKESDTHYLLHYKADRFHVGKSSYSEVKFTNHSIKYNPDDVFYAFSDGYPDQFGGDEERKFMYGPFKKLFLEIVKKPMSEQADILESRIIEWMRDYEQTDDMLVFGIKP